MSGSKLSKAFDEKRLARLREAKGLSQKHLAELLGVDHSAIAHYERGAMRPGNEIRKRMVGVFGREETIKLFFPQQNGEGEK